MVDRTQSDTLDEMMKLMGIPWIARKVADKLDITTVITHDPLNSKCETADYALGKLTATNAMVSDGKPAEKTGNDGKKVTVTCEVFPASPNDGADALGCLRITSVLPDNLGVTVETRVLAEGGRIQRSTMVYTRGGNVPDAGKQTVTKRVYVNKDWSENIRQSKETIPQPKIVNAPAPLAPAADTDPQHQQQQEGSDEHSADNAAAADAGADPNASGSRRASVASLAPSTPDSKVADTQAQGQGQASGQKFRLADIAAAVGSPAKGSLNGSAASGSGAAASSSSSSGGSRVSISSFIHTGGSASASASVGGGAIGGPDSDPFFVSFSGQWTTDYTASESLDELWRSIGVARIARLLVNAVDIVATLTHDPSSFVQEDKSALGKHVQHLPLDAEWHAVRQVDRRIMLMRAAQGHGAGDKGPSWLGYELGFIPAILDPTKPAGREAASGRRISGDGMSGVPGGDDPYEPVFSSAEFDPAQYTKSSIAVETLLTEVEPPGGLSGEGSGPVWTGAVPSATRLVVTYELVTRNRLVQHFTHLTEKGTVKCTAKRELIKKESPEEKAVATLLTRKRLSHARALLLSRRAAADATRKALLLRMLEEKAPTSPRSVVSPSSDTAHASPFSPSTPASGSAYAASEAAAAHSAAAATSAAASKSSPVRSSGVPTPSLEEDVEYDDLRAGYACVIM